MFVWLTRFALLATLIGVPPAADADTCWPDTVAPSITGQLLHYDYTYGGGTKGRPVMHAAMGRSQHGGHVWCSFMGTPENVRHLTQIWETDARGVKVVWRDPPQWLTMRNIGGERAISIYKLACARGTGPCYTRETPGWGTRVTDYARSCEKKNGQSWYVIRSTGLRLSRKRVRNGEWVEVPVEATYSTATERWQLFDDAGRTLADLNYYWHENAPGLEQPKTLPGDRMFRLSRIGDISELPCLTSDGACEDDLAERPDEGKNALYVCRAYADQHAVAELQAVND